MIKLTVSIILILTIFITFPGLYLSVKSDSKEYQNKVNSKKTDYLKKTKDNLIYLAEKYEHKGIDLDECLKNVLDVYTTNDLLQIYYLEKNKKIISQFPEPIKDQSSQKPKSSDQDQKIVSAYNIANEIFSTKNQYLFRLGITLNHPLEFLDLLKDKTFILKFSILMIFISSIIFFAIYLTSFSIDEKLYYKLSRSIERPFYFRYMYKFAKLTDPTTLVQSGVLALNNARKNKEEVNRLLSIDIPTKILKDLTENKVRLPIIFEGIIAGPDINNYTAFTESTAEFVNDSTGETLVQNAQKVISKKLIKIAAESILRYKGRFATSQGDNAVSIFENEQKELLAFSYCRDVMRIFSQIEFLIDGKIQKFTLKSSLVNGELEFEKNDLGSLAVSSDSFTVYNRLLSSVFETEKEQNIFVLEKSYLPAVESLILHKSELLTRTGKNLPSLLYVYQITQFKSIEEIYNSDFEKIHFFRSDDDIIFLLKKLKEESNLTKIEHIIKGFSLFYTNNITPKVVDNWISTLNFLNSEAKQNKIPWKILSYYISTARNLINHNFFTTELIAALFSIDNISDERTVASVASVFNYTGLYDQILNNKQWFFQSNFSDSKRIQSEFIVCDCLKNLGERSLKNIRKLLESKNILNQKSGIYIAHTVLEHHLIYNIDALYVMDEYTKIVGAAKKINTVELSDRMKAFQSEIIKSYDNVFNKPDQPPPEESIKPE